MWIKSLDHDTWVSMKHVTHFRIESDTPDVEPTGNNVVYAYLDSNELRWSPNQNSFWNSDQARILVCQGSQEECKQFIVEHQLLESAFQWIGYIVAGGIGAVLTYFLTGSG